MISKVRVSVSSTIFMLDLTLSFYLTTKIKDRGLRDPYNIEEEDVSITKVVIE